MIKCRACKKEINMKRDKYIHLEQYDKGNLVDNNWWHLICFNKSMNRELTTLEKQAQEMLKKASLLYKNLPGELFDKKEEYIIK